LPTAVAATRAYNRRMQPPEAAAWELSLSEPVALGETAAAALEDYAREVTASREAEALRAEAQASHVVAIRLRGLLAPPAPEAQDDVRAFARELAASSDTARLGWS